MNAAHEVSNDHNSTEARHGEKNSITRLQPHACHDIETMKNENKRVISSKNVEAVVPGEKRALFGKMPGKNPHLNLPPFRLQTL